MYNINSDINDAKKSPRLKLKLLAIKQYSATKSLRKVADQFNVSYKQIAIWIKKYDANGTEGLIDQRKGKVSMINNTDKLKILRYLSSTPEKNLNIENIQTYIYKISGVSLLKSSVYSLLRRNNVSIKEIRKNRKKNKGSINLQLVSNKELINQLFANQYYMIKDLKNKLKKNGINLLEPIRRKLSLLSG